MRSILIVNPKGGSGKTTISTNLASYYAVWKVPTALVDLDPQQSSMGWLSSRPEEADKIHGFNGLAGHITLDDDIKRVIYDAPARTDNNKVARLVKLTDAVIIPVLPSAIDMRAVAGFVVDLLRKIRSSNPDVLIGLVANRSHTNYKSYKVLVEFLKKLDIPVITSLRDSQNYIRSADQGIGIFEMAPSEVEVEIEQWRPLINWVEGKHKPE